MLGEGNLRTRLLAAVDAVAPRLEAANFESETLGGPTDDTIAAFREADLLGLKSPRILGGAEADWTLQTEVFEKVAYHNLSAAWCLMLYADNTGKALASLSDAGLARVMQHGIPAICGGGGLKIGTLTPVEGGYRLNGDWIYGSGIPKADYAMMSAVVAGKEAPQMRSVVVPVGDLIVADNWQVMGLKGTGSCDFSARDVFLPGDLAFDPRAEPRRGGALFRLGWFGYAGLCMPAVMIGAARRVLDDLAALAMRKARGYIARTTLADRGVFQAFLGEADLKLKAARALCLETGARMLQEAGELGRSPDRNEAETRAAGAYAARCAIEVVNGAIAYAGGEAVRAGHTLERTLRDMHMAGTHVFVSDIAFENHAHFVMGKPDAALQA